MAILRGILAGIGLDQQQGLQERHHHAEEDKWITHPRFEPVEGERYLLAFSRIPPQGEAPVIKRVRVDGPTIEDWIDLDEQRPLDRALYAYAVKAWQPLEDEDARAARLH
mgnify:CR=1 FL=1